MTPQEEEFPVVARAEPHLLVYPALLILPFQDLRPG